MREQCIPSLVESWFQILTAYQRSHPELTCQCLEVVGAYVSWIDLSLIANERSVGRTRWRRRPPSEELLQNVLFVFQLREPPAGPDVRGGAPGGGLRLPLRDHQQGHGPRGQDQAGGVPVPGPAGRQLLQRGAGGCRAVTMETLVQCPCSENVSWTWSFQEDDVDFLAKFSRLVNGMGQSLVLSWTKLLKGGQVKEAQETLQAVEAKVPLLLQLLVHEDDDISSNIVAFCYDYLQVLKQVSAVAPGPPPPRRTRPRLPPSHVSCVCPAS